MPDWLNRRGGALRPNPDGLSWSVILAGQPQYQIKPVPAQGKHACEVMQTNNGKRLESGNVFPSIEEAARGGLEDLRKALGW